MDLLKNQAERMEAIKAAGRDRPIAEVIDRIERLNTGLNEFWGQSAGWAPDGAAQLLSKSRLDWQVSLSGSLRHWDIKPSDSISEGDLILAWTNLGSLIEGTIKLFLSVFYEDYQNDLDTLKKTKAWHTQKQKLLDPDGLMLDPLIDYCEKAELFDKDELRLCRLVQTRRNAIHAYKDRPIGSGAELHQAMRDYLDMLRSVNSRLPYPDDCYEPRET